MESGSQTTTQGVVPYQTCERIMATWRTSRQLAARISDRTTQQQYLKDGPVLLAQLHKVVMLLFRADGDEVADEGPGERACAHDAPCLIITDSATSYVGGFE